MIRRPAFADHPVWRRRSRSVSGQRLRARPSPARAPISPTASRSVVKQAAPAVVNVYTRRVVQARNLSPLFNDPFFQQFFGNDFGGGVPQQRVQSSLGSGVILRADGLIVTNNHVIKNSDQITVVLSDRREFPAHVLLADERIDLALLKIDPGKTRCRPWRWRIPTARGRRFRARHRQSLRRRPDGDQRHHLGAGPHPGRHQRLRLLHPDRCGDQSGQFRRRAGHHGRQARRHQHGDLFAIRRIDRHRLRHSRQHGRKLPRRRAARAGISTAPWIGVSGQGVSADMAEALGLDQPTGIIVDDLYPGSPAAAGRAEARRRHHRHQRQGGGGSRAACASAWRPSPSAATATLAVLRKRQAHGDPGPADRAARDAAGREDGADGAAAAGRRHGRQSLAGAGRAAAARRRMEGRGHRPDPAAAPRPCASA